MFFEGEDSKPGARALGEAIGRFSRHYLVTSLVALSAVLILAAPDAKAAHRKSPKRNPKIVTIWYNGKRYQAIKNQYIVTLNPEGATNFAASLSTSGAPISVADVTDTALAMLHPLQQPKEVAPGSFLIHTATKPASINSTAASTADAGILQSVTPNFVRTLAYTPNDSSYDSLWGMKGTFGIKAPQAWDISFGSPNVVVGVADTGMDYTHQDLAANTWENPDEVGGDRIDNDGNGYIDDVRGYNFCADAICSVQNNNTQDDFTGFWHGTHVSGTIAAVGNNGIGVVGVAFHVKLMTLKIFNSNGATTDSAILSALSYALSRKLAGINLVAINASWGGGPYSSPTKSLIDQLGNAGVVFVAAAGNSGRNTDVSPNYPSGYASSNIIAVAAHDQEGHLASFSNYGATSVHISAPGVSILSTKPGNAYQLLSGTSMATPHVTGAVALLKSINPDLTVAQIIDFLKQGAAPDASLNGKVSTNGILDVFKSGQLANGGGTPPTVTPTSAPGTPTPPPVESTPTPPPVQSTPTFAPRTTPTPDRPEPPLGDSTGINFVTGAGELGGPHVRSYLPSGRALPPVEANFMAYDSSFRFGTRVAMGDIDGDGEPDIVTAPGQDDNIILNTHHVRVFDAKTGAQKYEFIPFPEWGTRSIRIAVGNVSGNCPADIIVSSGPPGDLQNQPRQLRVFSLSNGTFVETNRIDFGLNSLMDEVRLASFTRSDGRRVILTTQQSARLGQFGLTTTPQVTARDVETGLPIRQWSYFTPGISDVTAGHLSNQASPDVVVATKINLENRPTVIEIFGGNTFLAAPSATPGAKPRALTIFTPFPGFSGEVRVAVAFDQTLKQNVLITSAGPGGGPAVKEWRLVKFAGRWVAQQMTSFFAYDRTFRGGVYVAAANSGNSCIK